MQIFSWILTVRLRYGCKTDEGAWIQSSGGPIETIGYGLVDMDGLRDDTEMNQKIGLGWKDNAREMGKETSSVRVKDL